MTTTKEYRMVRIAPETHRKLRIIAAQTDESIITLIERLATQEQEKPNMTSETELTYRIPTNEDYYTQDSSDEYLVAGLLDNQEREITAYINEHFPGMAYEIERVPETQSYNNRSKAYSELGEQALEAVEYYVETHWYNWWPEPTE